MTRKKTFFDKLNAFIFGVPPVSPDTTSTHVLSELTPKLDALLALLTEQSPAVSPADGVDDIDNLVTQIHKLAKTQFKSNALQEAQLAQQQETIDSLQKSLEQQAQQLSALDKRHQHEIEAAQLDLLTGILPTLDGLDAAFESGRRQVLRLPMPAETRRAIIAWLDGIRLTRMRLLDVLAAHHITPIPTVGHPFDPRMHIVVATASPPDTSDGLIIAEDRRGYATPQKVLRFAEVVVARSR